MPVYKGWKVALACAFINFLVGINYTWSIYAHGLVEQKGWTYVQAALPYSIFLFCYALCMVFTGRAQDYFGPRPVISLGSIFAGGAFISCALFLNYPFAAAILWGLPLGIGLACCFASTTPAAMKWFPPQKKGRIAGIVVTSTGLAALVMSPFIESLVRESTAEALLVSGIFLAVGIFISSRFVDNPPGKISDLRHWLIRQRKPLALKDLRLYLLWLMFFLTTGTGVTLAAHLVNIMQVQAKYPEGYIAVAIFSFGNASGRYLGGWLSDRAGRIQSMSIVFGTIALTLVSLMVIRQPHLLMFAVCLLALSFGGLFSIFPSAVVNFFGEADFGLSYGIVFTGLGAAGIFP